VEEVEGIGAAEDETASSVCTGAGGGVASLDRASLREAVSVVSGGSIESRVDIAEIRVRGQGRKKGSSALFNDVFGTFLQEGQVSDQRRTYFGVN